MVQLQLSVIRGVSLIENVLNISVFIFVAEKLEVQDS
jgi:hypothetical protein